MSDVGAPDETLRLGVRMTYERVLAIGAHTDDIELGCAGLLSRLRREGSEVKVIVFSRAEDSLPDGVAADTLERECNRAMARLDLGPSAVAVHNLPVRRFGEFRQSILDDLVVINRQFDPLLVLTMSSRDTHQDHQVIHNESVRAFRSSTIVAYEIPWNQREAPTQLFVELAPEDIEAKSAMIAEYKSQSDLGRDYMDGNYASTAARFRGYQSKLPLAEAYEVVTMRWSLGSESRQPRVKADD
jgi:N-acetylglucosamine malate deacetylase 1